MKVDLLVVLKQLMSSYNIHVHSIEEPYDHIHELDLSLRNYLDKNYDWTNNIVLMLEKISESTLYITEDIIGVNYVFFKMPSLYRYICIGPFRFDESRFDYYHLEILSFNKEQIEFIYNYYIQIPSIHRDFIDLNIIPIISIIFPKDKFEVKYIKESMPFSFKDNITISETKNEFEDSMEMLEHRYSIENACLEAIYLGNATKAKQVFKNMENNKIMERFLPSLRTQKNGLIILNTLFRKVIEQAHVHPYYIDEISSRFARRIELITGMQEQYKLLDIMINEYCSYVKKYSLKQYSPLIQKVINYIHIHISEELSLNHISTKLHLNPSYLSHIFKDETGITITEYMNKQRIMIAAHRIKNSRDSISSISESVGIIDVNYFSRLFKRYMECTPREYRNNNKLSK